MATHVKRHTRTLKKNGGTRQVFVKAHKKNAPKKTPKRK